MRAGGRRGTVRAGALATCALASSCPAVAQIASERFVNNHPTVQVYNDTDGYEPAPGSDRAVIMVVFSEYPRDTASEVVSARLGGVELVQFGTRENVHQPTKTNRMTAFYLPEGRIPGGQSSIRLEYGPSASSSMVYVATATNVAQDRLGEAPVFVSNCVNGRQTRAGTIRFAPLAADPADIVLSFAGSGENENETTFNNGAEEFLDARRSSPGFSLAAGLQSPQTTVTIAGDATYTSGCRNRPITMQFKLRPLGSSGVLGLPTVAITPDGLTLRVEDADRNLRTGGVDRVTVTVTNPRTGQTETVTLVETGPDTGVFEAVLALSNDPDAGEMTVRDGDVLDVTYDDILTDDGGTRSTTVQAAVRDPAELAATKSVAMPDGYATPGADVRYDITVTNTGTGRADDGSLFLVDALPQTMDLVLTGTPVTVTGHPGIDFDYARDVRFAPPGAVPASLADCPVELAPGGVAAPPGYLCIEPKGTLPAGDPSPQLTASFRMRIR